MKPSADRPPLSETELRQLLSSLADGHAEHPDDLAHASAMWRDQPEARATWHRYQLIGDVMRSEDLARSAEQDSAFLQRFRARLAEEPVVLAPEALTTAAGAATGTGPARAVVQGRWRRAAVPAAAAAGFVAVAAALVVLRWGVPGASGEDAPLVAWWPGSGAASTDGVVPVSQGGWTLTSPAAQSASTAGLVSPGRMIRDPQLDAYLRAHRGAFAGAGQPAAAPRSLGGAAPVNTEAAAAAR
jgi:sigma-E factor negative regulatory protein RseA